MRAALTGKFTGESRLFPLFLARSARGRNFVLVRIRAGFALFPRPCSGNRRDTAPPHPRVLRYLLNPLPRLTHRVSSQRTGLLLDKTQIPKTPGKTLHLPPPLWDRSFWYRGERTTRGRVQVPVSRWGKPGKGRGGSIPPVLRSFRRMRKK